MSVDFTTDTGPLLGQCRAVLDEVAGSELSADEALGSTTLDLVHLEWASEGGGTIVIGGVDTRTYDSVNFDLETVHLTAGTSQIWTAGTRVEPNPTSVTRYMEVWSETEDGEEGPEPIIARVPNKYRDRFEVGTREMDGGEWVLISRVGDEWTFFDFPGEDLTVSLEDVDPTTIPHTDGFPPSVSPTPTIRGGVGALVVQWPGVGNDDPTEYEVHVSTSSSFTPVPGDANTLAGTIAGSMLWVRTLPLDGSQLDPDTTYYVRIITRDFDGTAAPGPVASGVPGQAGEDDILAGAVTAEKLEGVLAILGSIILGAVDTDGNPVGQHVRGDANGLVLKSASGVPLVTLPTDPSQDPTFAGEIVAGALTVIGNAIMRGKTTIDRGGTLVLGDGVSDPETTPTLTADYPSQDLYPTDTANTTYRYGLLLDGSNLYFTLAFPSSSRVVKTTLAGAFVSEVTNLGAGYTSRGLTKVGTDYYVLARNDSTGQHVVFRHNSSWSVTASFPVSSVNMNAVPTIGTDGTDLLVAYRNASGFLEVRKYTITGTLSSTTTTNVLTPESICTGIVQGNFDFGAARWVFLTTGHVYVTTTAGVGQPNEYWNVAAGNEGGGGLIWDSGNALGFGVVFVQMSRASKRLIANTTWTWTTASGNYYVRYSWYDSNAAGTGTHETNVSPAAFISMPKRARLNVVIPDIPIGAGSNDDPNSARLYMVPKATPPIVSEFKLQATPTVVATALTTYNAAGAAPPAVTNFPASSPAELRSGPLFNAVPLLRGNGVPRVKVKNGGGTSVPDNNITVIPVATKDADTDNFWDSVIANPYVILPFSGAYECLCQLSFAVNSNGRRTLTLQSAPSPYTTWTDIGADLFASAAPVGTDRTTVLVAAMLDQAAATGIRVRAYQNSSVALNCQMRMTLLFSGPT